MCISSGVIIHPLGRTQPSVRRYSMKFLDRGMKTLFSGACVCAHACVCVCVCERVCVCNVQVDSSTFCKSR